MTRGDWEAATPKCPKGEVSNIPGAICAEPMVYAAPTNIWRCPAHGVERSGESIAQRAGYAGMWFSDAA